MTKIISSSIIIKELNLNTELNKILDELEQEVLKEIESDSKHELLKRHLERQLIKYLSKYLKKDFAMELVFVSISKTLKNQEEITDKQFESIITFLERELPFRRQSRNRIYDYFSPVIRKTKEKIVTSSLEEFFDDCSDETSGKDTYK